MRIRKEKDENDKPDFGIASRRALFGKEAANLPVTGKSAVEQPNRHLRVKVTMNLDGDIVTYFKQRGLDEGRSYQVLINDALRECIEGSKPEKLAQMVGGILLTDASFVEILKQTILGDNKEQISGL